MSATPHVALVIGLSLGDESKGACTDFLARQAKGPVVVTRFNGGSQAGHHVCLADGRHHVFAQFGSGTLAGAATHLSRFMLVDPIAMMAEAAHLESIGVRDPFSVTTIEGEATMITPFQVAANQLRELHRSLDGQRHGSCGKGVGEARGDMLKNPGEMPKLGDLHDLARLKQRLEMVQAMKCAEMVALWGDRPHAPGTGRLWEILAQPESVDLVLAHYADFQRRARIVGPEHLATLLHQEGTVLFEGAQGVLLDEDRGFHPHTTWTNTTFKNADTILDETGFEGVRRRIGLTRCYGTRHGAGPFPTEDEGLRALVTPGEHNIHNDWQEGFRVGQVDAVLLRYAVEVVGGVDELGVSHLDRYEASPESFTIARCYRVDPDARDLLGDEVIGARLAIPAEVDIEEQTKMGAELREVTPIYSTSLPHSGEGFAREIAETVGVPLGIVAFGPTAADRRMAR